jgi:hypothetical protein
VKKWVKNKNYFLPGTLKMPCFVPVSPNWSHKGPVFTRTSLSEYFLLFRNIFFATIGYFLAKGSP